MPFINTRIDVFWHVEQAIRISKSDLQARPIYHRTQDAIRSHIVICFIHVGSFIKRESMFNRFSTLENKWMHTVIHLTHDVRISHLAEKNHLLVQICSRAHPITNAHRKKP